MAFDNGPKDGDFASYVEALSRRQLHSLGQTHSATPSVHDDARSAETGPNTPNRSSAAEAIHNAGAASGFHMSAKPWSSNRLEALAARLTTPTGAAKSTLPELPELLRGGRWALRVIALMLIAAGLFAVHFSAVPIVLGILLLSLSFRKFGRRNDAGS